MSTSAIKFFGVELKSISGNKTLLLNSFIKDIFNVQDKSEISVNVPIDRRINTFYFNFMINKLSLKSSLKHDSDDENDYFEDDENLKEKKKEYFSVTLEKIDKQSKNSYSKGTAEINII